MPGRYIATGLYLEVVVNGGSTVIGVINLNNRLMKLNNRRISANKKFEYNR